MADEEIKLQITSSYEGGGGKEAGDDLKNIKAGMQEAGGIAEQASGQIASFGEATDKTAEMIGGLREALEKLPESTALMTENTEKMKDALGDASEEVPRLADAFSTLPGPAHEASQQISNVGSTVSKLDDQIRPTLPPLDDIRHSIATLGEQAVTSAPAITGVTDAFAGMVRTPVASFNEAVSAASKMNMPFTVLQNSIDAAGISWSDFVGQLSPEYQGRLEKLASNSLYAGQTVGELAKSYSGADAQAATFFGNVAKENDAIGGFGKGIEGVNAASKGMGISGIFEEVSGAIGQMSEGLMQVAMPIFAMQAIGMVVQAVGQSLYDTAAIAEGPAAHSIGTFTGAVDQITVSAGKAAASFSEAFGRELIPDLNAVNSSMQDGGLDGMGKDFGIIAGLTAGPAAIMLGAITSTIPGMGAVGGDIQNLGMRMTVNSGAALLGLPQPFVSNTPTVDYASMNAQLLQDAQKNIYLASDPQYLATMQTAAYRQFKEQQAVQQVAMYDVSHWSGSTGFSDPRNAMIQAEMVRSTGQSYGGGVDPNAAYFNSLPNVPIGPNTSAEGGCFPPGTLITLASGGYKPIERIQVGDMVASQYGPARVNDAFAYQFKGIYKILFNNASTLYLTDGHPVATPDGWKSINPITTAREHAGLVCHKIEVGDRVISHDGSQFAIVSITISHIADTVYNLTVSGNHTYYASGFLVHNSKLSMSVADAVGQTQIPPNSLQNSDMMSSISANFQGLDLNKTFSVSVAWNVAGDLFHSFIGNPIWNTAGDLFHSFIGNPIWNTAGDLFHSFIGNPVWNTAGDLFHSFIGNPIWNTAGDLFHAFIGNPIWNTAGDLFHAFIGNPIWNTVGDLAHVFSGNPIWQADGLTHLFSGKALWQAEDLVHQFVATALWTANNLTPTFNVSALFTGLPMLAGGIQNFGGGAAIVGERGPELITLPAGSSVYPNDSLPSIGAQAGTNLAGLIGGAGGQGSLPLMLNIHFDSIQVAQAILPQLAPIMHAQFGVMM